MFQQVIWLVVVALSVAQDVQEQQDQERSVEAFRQMIEAERLGSGKSQLVIGTSGAGNSRRGILKNLPPLVVRIYASDELLLAINSREEALKTEIELELRRNGIRIHPGGGAAPWPELSGPELEFGLFATSESNVGHRTYMLTADLVERVILERNPYIVIVGSPTWQADEIVGFAGSGAIGDVVGRAFREQLNEFNNDYLAANAEK